jgi:hypothetical protein
VHPGPKAKSKSQKAGRAGKRTKPGTPWQAGRWVGGQSSERAIFFPDIFCGVLGDKQNRENTAFVCEFLISL